MDVRSRNIADPDRRVGDRIVGLPEDEQGWIKVNVARVGKTDATFASGTIGWLTLPKALAAWKKDKSAPRMGRPSAPSGAPLRLDERPRR